MLTLNGPPYIQRCNVALSHVQMNENFFSFKAETSDKERIRRYRNFSAISLVDPSDILIKKFT